MISKIPTKKKSPISYCNGNVIYSKSAFVKICPQNAFVAMNFWQTFPLKHFFLCVFLVLLFKGSIGFCSFIIIILFFFIWIFLLFKYLFMYLWVNVCLYVCVCVYVFVLRNTRNGNTLAFNSKRILFSFPRFRSRILMHQNLFLSEQFPPKKKNAFFFFFWVHFELGANLIDNNNNTNRAVNAPVPELQHFRRDSRETEKKIQRTCDSE